MQASQQAATNATKFTFDLAAIVAQNDAIIENNEVSFDFYLRYFFMISFLVY
jgi:hypothetical protein